MAGCWSYWCCCSYSVPLPRLCWVCVLYFSFITGSSEHYISHCVPLLTASLFFACFYAMIWCFSQLKYWKTTGFCFALTHTYKQSGKIGIAAFVRHNTCVRVCVSVWINICYREKNFFPIEVKATHGKNLFSHNAENTNWRLVIVNYKWTGIASKYGGVFLFIYFAFRVVNVWKPVVESCYWVTRNVRVNQ